MQPTTAKVATLIGMMLACCAATIALVLFPAIAWKEANLVMLPVSIGTSLLASVAFVRLVHFLRASHLPGSSVLLWVGGLLAFVTWTPFILLAYSIVR